MIQEKLISVIIPVYNAGQYIERCVESVLSQTYSNLEVVLVNDGSKDNSGRLCDKYKEVDARVNVIHIENSGVSKARNIGLSVAKGEYISFLDADDYLDKNFLFVLCDRLENDLTDVCVCVADEKVKNREASIINIDDTFNILDYKFITCVWGKLYRQTILKDIIFSEDIFVAEDTFFFLQVLNRVQKLSVINGELYHYTENANSVMHSKFTEARYTEIIALERICSLFENRPLFYEQCKARYVLRCKGMICLMHLSNVIDKERMQWLKKQVRSNMKCLFAVKLPYKTKLCTFVFALLPNIYCFAYKIIRRNRGYRV